MKKIYTCFLIATLCSLNAFAQDKTVPNSNASSQKERADAIRKELAYLIAPIKTATDLHEYLNSANMQNSPLKKLSEASRERFLSSLTFNEKGLSGFRYEDMENELKYTQIYQILGLFGAQDATMIIKGAKSTSSLDSAITTMGSGDGTFYADYKDYYCSGRATCSQRGGDICMSGC